MTAEISGELALRARIDALRSVGKPITGIVGLAAVREQKKLVPRKTGNLGRTIHLERVTAREAFTVASAVYARPVEFGSKPHIIRPRKAKALFFASQRATTDRFGAGAKLKFTQSGRLSKASVKEFGNSAFVVARVVHHPGTKARPFMVPGARKALSMSGVQDVIVRIWNNAA